jgi:phosphoenolpyruvate synthase/pyruvate phosphate dikinase
MTAPPATRWIYDFSEGSRDMRDLLVGNGANVAEMTRVLGRELVPPGFTVTTEACVSYLRSGSENARGARRRRGGGTVPAGGERRPSSRRRGRPPAKLSIEVLEPIDLAARYGSAPDVTKIYGDLVSVMQRTLDDLAAHRTWPVLG